MAMGIVYEVYKVLEFTPVTPDLATETGGLIITGFLSVLLPILVVAPPLLK
jgi:hypothetical protein